MSVDNLKEFKGSLKTAYYNSMLEAKLKTEIPIAFPLVEIFEVEIFEDNSKILKNITFAKEGLQEYSKIPNKKLILDYKNVDSDDEGNKCAFWFKNINVPKEMELVNNDNNCCIMFKKKGINKSKVFICSIDKFRCVKPIKIIVKSMKKGCSLINGENNYKKIENEYNEEEGQTNEEVAKNQLEEISVDEENGKFEGETYIFDLIDDEIDEINEKKSLFLKIGDEDKIKIFSNKSSEKPLEAFNSFKLNNGICNNDKELVCCKVMDFIENLDNINNVKIDEIKKKIENIKERLPKESGLDLCSVIQINGKLL